MWSIQFLSCLCSERVGVVEVSVQWAEIKAGHSVALGQALHWNWSAPTLILALSCRFGWNHQPCLLHVSFFSRSLFFFCLHVVVYFSAAIFFSTSVLSSICAHPMTHPLSCQSQSFDLKTQIYSPYPASSRLTLDSECIWCLLCLIYSCIMFSSTASSTTAFQQPSQFHRPRPGKTNKNSTYRGPQWIS